MSAATRAVLEARGVLTPLSPEERAALDAQRQAAMRPRLRIVCWVLIALTPLFVLFAWLAEGQPSEQGASLLVLRILMWVGIAWWLRSERGEYRWVRLAGLVVFLSAMLGPTLAVAIVVFSGDTSAAPLPDTPAHSASKSVLGTWALLSSIGILLALPWSVAEVAVATGLGVLVMLLLSLPNFIESTNPADTADTILSITLLGVIAMGVGLAASAARRASFGRARMAERVAKVTRELEIAREVHDAVFPHATRASGWAFDFHYEPMQQIGGDYAFLRPLARSKGNEREGANHVSDAGGVIAGLIDVTGHGIASALTVNRLHGEIDRFLADHPNAGPEELLANLNRYLHLTLSERSIFATAVCVRCEGRVEGGDDDGWVGRVEFASAGHPPMMLRRGAVSDGSVGGVESFGATGPVLGALPPEVFELRRQTITLGPGDRLLAFTDGILEARGDDGEMLWVEGVRGLVATLGPGPAGSQLSAAVRAYRRGPALDDVLVMEIAREARG